MAATAARETSGRLLNRELSTLEYNARLLDLAGDDSLPLLERVKMCRFVSSNLDEFFMVRVAGLMGQAAAGLAVRSSDGLTPRSALALIRERVLELTARQAKLWKKTLAPALADEGIVIAQIEDLDADELTDLEERFQREIFPVLTPLGVGPGQPFPYISGLSLSLGVLARDPESGEERFARVKVPEGLPRFFEVGQRGRLLPLETPIAHFLDRLFPGMEILERSVFRVTQRRRLRGLGRGRRPARGGRARVAAPPLRGCGPGGGLELDLARHAGTAVPGTRRRTRAGLRDPRPTRPCGPRSADRPRPPGAQVRAVARGDAVASRACERAARPVRGDQAQRLPRPSAVRVVRGQLRGVRRRPPPATRT